MSPPEKGPNGDTASNDRATIDKVKDHSSIDTLSKNVSLKQKPETNNASKETGNHTPIHMKRADTNGSTPAASLPISKLGKPTMYQPLMVTGTQAVQQTRPSKTNMNVKKL